MRARTCEGRTVACGWARSGGRGIDPPPRQLVGTHAVQPGVVQPRGGTRGVVVQVSVRDCKGAVRARSQAGGVAWARVCIARSVCLVRATVSELLRNALPVGVCRSCGALTRLFPRASAGLRRRKQQRGGRDCCHKPPQPCCSQARPWQAWPRLPPPPSMRKSATAPDQIRRPARRARARCSTALLAPPRSALACMRSAPGLQAPASPLGPLASAQFEGEFYCRTPAAPTRRAQRAAGGVAGRVRKGAGGHPSVVVSSPPPPPPFLVRLFARPHASGLAGGRGVDAIGAGCRSRGGSHGAD